MSRNINQTQNDNDASVKRLTTKDIRAKFEAFSEAGKRT